MLRLKLSVIDGNLPGKIALTHFTVSKKEVFSMLYLEVIRMVSIDMEHSTTNEPIDQKG